MATQPAAVADLSFGPEVERSWRAYEIFYHAHQDRLLGRLVLPLVRDLLREGVIDRFFFIRYELGGPHVRLRWRAPSDSDVDAAEALLAERAADFFALWPSPEPLPEEEVRRTNRMLLDLDPMTRSEDDQVHPDNSWRAVPPLFEVERYGGPECVGASLDLFTLSSARVLQWLGARDEPGGGWVRPAYLRLTLQLAWGLAGGEEEFFDLAGYGPRFMGEAFAPCVEQGDAVFTKRRGEMIERVRGDLEALADPDLPGANIADIAGMAAAGCCLGGGNWYTLASHIHMTANRLGLKTTEEVYLSRLLWRAADALRREQPSAWEDLWRQRAGFAERGPAAASRREDRSRARGADRMSTVYRKTAVERLSAPDEMTEMLTISRSPSWPALARFFPLREKAEQPRQRPVRTPSVIQMEALDCGPAVLAIVLAHFGRWVPIEELRVACGVSRNGSKASNILRAARAYGLEAQGFKVEPEGLRRLAPPAVLHWSFNHFVVFEGFDRRGRARINDPGAGHRRISAAELDEAMTGVMLAFEPGPSFERKGEPPRLLRSLRQRLSGASGAWAALAFIFLVSLLLVVPGLLMPALSRGFVDQVLVGGESARAMPLLGAMAAALAALGGLGWLQRGSLLRFETRMAVDGTRRFFWHLLHLPTEFFNQRFTGDLSARVALNDRVAELLSRDLAVSLLSALMLVFFAAVMVRYDPLLTCVSILVVSLNFLVLQWVSQQRADGNRRLLRELGKLNGTALWGLEMIESLKATGSESDLFARWAGQQARVVNVRQELERANQPLEMLPPLLAAVNAALVLGVGGLRVVEGRLSIGDLVAFQILTAAFVAPVNRIVSLGSRLQTAEGEVGMLEDVLRSERAIPEDIEDTEDPEDSSSRLSGRLELRGITFGYSPLDPPVVEDLSFALEPGACIAVVGRTGSGKSTLARLVTGLYKPWRGEILFDGRPPEELPRGLWTRSVAVVDQDVFVFEGTVRENLTLWDGARSMDRVAAAARDACIHDEIAARPGGFDAPVAEGGANWSGGQLQRLEIARALAGDPALLVLDEATSALDPETEARIVQNLRRRGCACLVIAHRLSTVRDADQILVLEEGRVVQRGSHDELMTSGGPYARLIVHE